MKFIWRKTQKSGILSLYKILQKKILEAKKNYISFKLSLSIREFH